jgi:hypothetical protein
MDDSSILARITALIDRERELRSRRESGTVGETDAWELAEAEVELDQCWDLLRQRRARRDSGGNADEAEVRSEAVVEHYRQ